jgi:hypothetical protein
MKDDWKLIFAFEQRIKQPLYNRRPKGSMLMKLHYILGATALMISLAAGSAFAQGKAAKRAEARRFGARC